MPNSTILVTPGLYTFQNFLSSIPQGALIKAENVNIDRDNIIEPGRGFTQYGNIGTTPSRAKQLFDYKGRLLSHYDTKIAYDNGSGTFTDLSEAYTETSSGLRIKASEFNGNLYSTSSVGIRKIATTSASPFTTVEEELAGGLKASDLSAVTDHSLAGFMSAFSKVSYRVAWLKKDINNNLIIGYPSARYEVINSTPESCQVKLFIATPPDATADHFFQVYRSSVAIASPSTLAALSEISSNDELRQVYEAIPTASELSLGTIEITDIVPEDYRDGGANLYTNENSGSGIIQANSRPPFAHDLTFYKNTAFFSNTKSYHNMNLDLTGMDGIQEIATTSTAIAGGFATITFPSPHGLGIFSSFATTNPYFVFYYFGPSTSVGYDLFDGTYQIYDSTATTIRFVFSGTYGLGSEFSVFPSYITIMQNAVSERYFLVGKQAINTFNFTIKPVAGNYLQMRSMNDITKYYLWIYNTDTLTGADPAISGEVGIKVDVITADTLATTIVKIATALSENTSDFIINTTATTMTLTTPYSGSLTNQVQAVPGLTVNITQRGFGEDTGVGRSYVQFNHPSVGGLSTSQAIEATARSLVKVVNIKSTLIDAAYTSSTNEVPGKMFFEDLVFSTDPFTVIASTSSFGEMFSPDITLTLSSTNEESINRIVYSKTNEPEHVPKINYIDIGPKDKAIIRIIGLQDSLFIFKEEGIYRLTGDNSSNFNVRLHDSSGIITAPDSAVVLNNQIYCYTTQGIVAVSEAGMSIISRPIENLILQAYNNTNFSSSTFGIASETDRTLLMFTTTNDTDTVAEIAYRYNIFTRAWTTYSKQATCGILNSSLNKFFLGVNDSNLIESERKTYSRRDYANRQYTRAFNSGTKIGNTIALSSATSIKAGDIIVQTQKLTISFFNRLLRRLDTDILLKHPSIADYFLQEAAEAGDDLNDNITALVTKLNLQDTSAAVYSYTPSSSFTTMQSNFNSGIITILNSSDGAYFSDYETSTGSVEFEQRIDTLTNNTVTSSVFQPIIVGDCVVYNYIPIDIKWAPNHFGDPSSSKHVRESTIMFEDTSFVGASFGFNTDLSANYESVDFSMTGDGLFGGSDFDSGPFGGNGLAFPFRTYIPRNKQRCRFIRARFQSNTAFTRFAILGISFVFEGMSERAYK